MKKILLAGLVLSLSVISAQAEYIEAPAFPGGQYQINNTISYLHGKDDESPDSLEFTYGVNDWLAVVAAFNSGGVEGKNYNYYSGADFTLQFDLQKETDDLPGTAFRITYSPDTGNDAVQTTSMMSVFEKKIGNIDNFLNIAIGESFANGNNGPDGFEYGVAAQTMYGLNDYTSNDEWSAGIEYFGDYGVTGRLQGFANKGQNIGPIIGFQPLKDLQTSLNYLIGLDHNAPRSTVTFEVNLTF